MHKKLLFSIIEKQEGLSSLQILVEYNHFTNKGGSYTQYGYNMHKPFGSLIPSDVFLNGNCTIETLYSTIYNNSYQGSFFFYDPNRLCKQYNDVYVQRKDTNEILLLSLSLSWSGNDTSYLLDYYNRPLFFSNADIDKTIPLEIWFS